MCMAPGGRFILVLVRMGMRVPGLVVIMAVRVSMVMMIMMATMIVRMKGVRFATQQTQKSAPLYPKEPQADQHNQPIADNFDDADGIAHRFCGRAEQCGSYADDRDGGERLKYCRRDR